MKRLITIIVVSIVFGIGSGLIVKYTGLGDIFPDREYAGGLVFGVLLGLTMPFIIRRKYPKKDGESNIAAAVKSWYGMNRYLRSFYTTIFVFFIGMTITQFIHFSEEMRDVVILFAFPMCVATGLAVAFMLRKNNSTTASD